MMSLHGSAPACNGSLQALKARREAEIFAHESAHANAAGGFGGSINIVRDSNGIPVSGFVPITIPPLTEENAEARINDYATIKAAALAPSDPSGQDFSVAAKADALMGKARELTARASQKGQAPSESFSPLRPRPRSGNGAKLDITV